MTLQERAASIAQELSVHILRATIAKLTGRGVMDLRGRSKEQLRDLAESPLLDQDHRLLLHSALECTRDKFLAGVHVARAHDQTSLLAMVNYLQAFLKEHRRVRLVIIDSIAFHFRQVMNMR